MEDGELVASEEALPSTKMEAPKSVEEVDKEMASSVLKESLTVAVSPISSIMGSGGKEAVL